MIIRKHTTLLLELLIALFLLSVCLFPLIRIPYRAMEEERKNAWRLYVPRLADLAFAEVLAQLHAQEIKWETISESCNKIVLIDSSEKKISIPLVGMQTFLQTIQLHSVGKEGKDGKVHYLLKYKVILAAYDKNALFYSRKKSHPSISKHSYSFVYQVCVTAKPLHKTPSS